jgi:hypothetical protein
MRVNTMRHTFFLLGELCQGLLQRQPTVDERARLKLFHSSGDDESHAWFRIIQGL